MIEAKQVNAVRGMLREPSAPEILKYRRADTEFLGFITKPGWSSERPYYRFKCTIHGQVENYLQGYSGTFYCPHCQDDAV